MKNLLELKVGGYELIVKREPLVIKQHHFYKNADDYYTSTCPRHFGESCPICDAAYSYHKHHKDTKEKTRVAFQFLRDSQILPRTKYYSSGYVLSSPFRCHSVSGETYIIRNSKYASNGNILYKLDSFTKGEDFYLNERDLPESEDCYYMNIDVKRSDFGNTYGCNEVRRFGMIPNTKDIKWKDLEEFENDLIKKHPKLDMNILKQQYPREYKWVCEFSDLDEQVFPKEIF